MLTKWFQILFLLCVFETSDLSFATGSKIPPQKGKKVHLFLSHEQVILVQDFNRLKQDYLLWRNAWLGVHSLMAVYSGSGSIRSFDRGERFIDQMGFMSSTFHLANLLLNPNLSRMENLSLNLHEIGTQEQWEKKQLEMFDLSHALNQSFEKRYAWQQMIPSAVVHFLGAFLIKSKGGHSEAVKYFATGMGLDLLMRWTMPDSMTLESHDKKKDQENLTMVYGEKVWRVYPSYKGIGVQIRF